MHSVILINGYDDDDVHYMSIVQLTLYECYRADILGLKENAGLENDGLKSRAGQCRTGIWQTKEQCWKMQD